MALFLTLQVANSGGGHPCHCLTISSSFCAIFIYSPFLYPIILQTVPKYAYHLLAIAKLTQQSHYFVQLHLSPGCPHHEQY